MPDFGSVNPKEADRGGTSGAVGSGNRDGVTVKNRDAKQGLIVVAGVIALRTDPASVSGGEVAENLVNAGAHRPATWPKMTSNDRHDSFGLHQGRVEGIRE